MNYLALLKGRTRALLTDFSSLAVIIIAVAVSIYISIYNNADTAKGIVIEIVNDDEGALGERLTEILSLEEGFDFHVTTYDEAITNLASDKAQGIIEITPDFSERISKGEYESLIRITVMADSYEMKTFTELVINDVIKVWSEELVKKRIGEIDGATEDDIKDFSERTQDAWSRDALLDIDAIMAKGEKEEKEETFYGLRWYAALAMFYLCISGTWMCSYSSTGLLRRVTGRGGRISLLFAFQSLPGIAVTLLGFIPVLVVSGHPNPLRVFVSFMIYISSSAAVALFICCLSGKFSNLVLVAPIATMAVSLFAGLLCELPNWAKVWDITSVVVPGHWFYNSIFGQRFFLGSVLVFAGWLAIGLFISWLFGKKKRKE